MTQENKTIQVDITLEQARKWAEGKNEDLQTLAYSAYTFDELFPHLYYKQLQCMGDILKYLGIKNSEYRHTIDILDNIGDDTLAPTYRINLIAKAINGNWTPSCAKKCYYPEIKVVRCSEGDLKQLKEKYWNSRLIMLTQDESLSSKRLAVFMQPYWKDNPLDFFEHSGVVRKNLYFETQEKCEQAIEFFGREIFQYFKDILPLK
jgi:hypothetical protein